MICANPSHKLIMFLKDTLKAPPSENKTMKRVSIYSIGTTTLFYLSLGFVGYGAFGAATPGNILVGFYEPFWLIGIGNIAVVVHMIGGYQVFSQPAFALCENWCSAQWSSSSFFHSVHKLRLPFAGGKSFEFTFSKLVVRTIIVCLSTLVSATLPFFNAMLGLLGSIAFWPMTVHYPVCMHIAQAQIKRRSIKWVALMAMSSICLLVSLMGAAGSVVDIAKQLRHARPFHFQ
ncbi:hypothetical protein Taro_015892 [Colocasia esculenta]|uniref:Amino acid transporter transmembrane domain-containing protein n=1 Tax=Colocasia esculenta TaxID=4460 RepID=A0A843UNJ5_COLES|nr:hypothetical protein [Colocasia esculenta]